MKRLLTTAAIALLMVTGAHAKMTDYANIGNWTASRGISDKGNPMCGMSTYWLNRGNVVAGLQFKYTTGNGMGIHLFKHGWRLKDDTSVNVSFSFDNSREFPGEATAFNAPDGPLLSVNVKPGTEIDFIDMVGDAKKMIVRFPDGDEPNWLAVMTGSREISAKFKTCIIALENNRPTQPTGKAAPTQPTGKAKKPAKDDGQI